MPKYKIQPGKSYSIGSWPLAVVETRRADGRGFPSWATLGKTRPKGEMENI